VCERKRERTLGPSVDPTLALVLAREEHTASVQLPTRHPKLVSPHQRGISSPLPLPILSEATVAVTAWRKLTDIGADFYPRKKEPTGRQIHHFFPWTPQSPKMCLCALFRIAEFSFLHLRSVASRDAIVTNSARARVMCKRLVLGGLRS
jgi:hypothetical protein